MAERTKPQSVDSIPTNFAHGQWTPEAYNLHEGGEWVSIGPAESTPKNYSSLRYRNGWIFDNVLKQMGVNPWRHVEDD